MVSAEREVLEVLCFTVFGFNPRGVDFSHSLCLADFVKLTG